MRLLIVVLALGLTGAMAPSRPTRGQTAEELQRQSWRTDRHAAFAEARRRIAAATDRLNFSDPAALSELPPEIGRGGFRTLMLHGSNVSDFSLWLA